MLLVNGDGVATFFGIEFVRLHAMLNDLPAALLVAAVGFELLYLLSKKESLKSAAFWTLLAGVAGAGLAIWAGLQAEEAVEHGTAIHELMERHETLAFVAVGIFAVVAVWRLLRERKMGTGERWAALIVALVGAGVLYTTGKLGGRLMFEHAAGIPAEVMQQELENREAGHEHAPGEEHDHPAAEDSSAVPAPSPDSGAPEHQHAPGTPPHEH